MSIIKNCPFCGGKAILDVGGEVNFRVTCVEISECGATQYWFDSAAEAIAAWNRRVSNAPI